MRQIYVSILVVVVLIAVSTGAVYPIIQYNIDPQYNHTQTESVVNYLHENDELHSISYDKTLQSVSNTESQTVDSVSGHIVRKGLTSQRSIKQSCTEVASSIIQINSLSPDKPPSEQIQTKQQQAIRQHPQISIKKYDAQSTSLRETDNGILVTQVLCKTSSTGSFPSD
jgi:Mn-containing catalase